MGDVLRTTALLHGIKRAWRDSEIWWITSVSAIDLLKGNNYINRPLVFNKRNSRPLKKIYDPGCKIHSGILLLL